MGDETASTTDLGLAIALVCLDYELYNVYDLTEEGSGKYYVFNTDPGAASFIEIRRAYFDGTLQVNAKRFYDTYLGVQSGKYFRFKARAAELPNY